MTWVWATILTVLNLCWLFVVLLGVPGNWLMVCTTLLCGWLAKGMFSRELLIAVFLLAVLGEIVEFFAGAGGARKSGAGWKGTAAACLGGIVGGLAGTFLIPVPVIGTLLGASLGAGFGTYWVEHQRTRDHAHSQRTGVGAGVGVLVGTLSKFAIGVVIFFAITLAAFMP